MPIPASAKTVSTSCLKASMSCVVNPTESHMGVSATVTCSAWEMSPNTFSFQVVPLNGLQAPWELLRTGQIPHLSSSGTRQQSLAVKVAGWAPSCCPSALQPSPVPSGWRPPGASLHHSGKWWFGGCRHQMPSCTIRTTWQTSTSDFLSQLHREIPRSYHTFS